MAEQHNGKSSKNILVFCAHPDDEVLGVGSTIAKYAKDGYKVTTVIFSYGEKSHPWLQRKITVQTRVKESMAASTILGCEETLFLGLKEGQFFKHMRERKTILRILDLIEEKRPEKVFMHSVDDPHPDHKAINTIVLAALRKSGIKTELYSFDVWNPFSVRNRNLPVLVVDVSKTYRLKAKALQKFKSQKIAMSLLIPPVYIKTIVNGFNYHIRFADVFHRIDYQVSS